MQEANSKVQNACQLPALRESKYQHCPLAGLRILPGYVLTACEAAATSTVMAMQCNQVQARCRPHPPIGAQRHRKLKCQQRPFAAL